MEGGGEEFEVTRSDCHAVVRTKVNTAEREGLGIRVFGEVKGFVIYKSLHLGVARPHIYMNMRGV